MKTLQELIKEQTLLKEANLTILMDLAYDSDKEMTADMKKFGINAKFYKRHGGAEEYKVTGPKDKLKKYVLDWGKNSYDKDELSDMYPELFEQEINLEVENEFDALEEAVNQFAELPNSWKKIVSNYGSFGGENSKVISKASKSKFSQIEDVANFISRSIKFDDVSLVWAEINDKPVFAFIKNETTYSMLTDEGNYKTVRKMYSTAGNKNRRRYFVDERGLTKTDIKSKIHEFFMELFDVSQTKDISPEQLNKFLSNISIKGMGADQLRLDLRNSRKENKMTTGQDQIYTNKIELAIKKLKNKMGVDVETFRKRIDKEFSKFEQGDEFDFSKIIHDMNKFVGFLSDINGIRTSYKTYNKYKGITSQEVLDQSYYKWASRKIDDILNKS